MQISVMYKKETCLVTIVHEEVIVNGMLFQFCSGFFFYIFLLANSNLNGLSDLPDLPVVYVLWKAFYISLKATVVKGL